MNLMGYVYRQIDWSMRTFGVGLRTVGVTEHIKKEIEEIRAEPADVKEWIDIIILAIDGYWRAGGQPADLEWFLIEKQLTNFKRQWPVAGSEDQPVEHVR